MLDIMEALGRDLGLLTSHHVGTSCQGSAQVILLQALLLSSQSTPCSSTINLPMIRFPTKP